jgi:uncharacterized zinc-type alcohol dehydrogenase-like protein
MIDSFGYAALTAKAPLEPFAFNRRALKSSDILLEIDYAGICHSDIHQAREEWGSAIFPMVPGHEIVGRVIERGSDVTKFSVGDLVGVGVYIDSCRECSNCRSGMSHYCDNGMTGTYNSYERDGITPTYGGYSTNYVIDQDYAVKVPANLDLAGVAPLLCAGITLYSPIKHWGVKAGMKVAVMGLGGLGHMGVKFAAAMGAEVTVISHSPNKESDARAMGAANFISSKNGFNLNREFDLILNTVSAEIDIEPYIKSLKVDGTLVCIGLPGKPYLIGAGTLLDGRKRVAGSMIGSVSELQEMLDFCGQKNIVSDVEVIKPTYINEAYERCVASDVKYRFVIDIINWRKSLPK